MTLQRDYQSKSVRWYDNSIVRTTPRRVLDSAEFGGQVSSGGSGRGGGDGVSLAWPEFSDPEFGGKPFFSPELIPFTQHPVVRGRGPATIKAALVQHLYNYLRFTKNLEQRVVNVVTLRLADGEAAVELSDDMRAYADAIYTDEAFHAQFCSDFDRQIQAATGIAPAFKGRPRFLARLAEIRERLPADIRPLADVSFAVVSETLISGTLTKVPKDDRVVTAVRQIMADHAHDEGQHHAYFAVLFELLWPRLTRRERETIGPLLPQFIRVFLDPDYEAIQAILDYCGLAPREAATVLEESYPEASIAAGAKEAATATLNLFKRNGVMDEAAASDAFAACGLAS